MLRIIIVISLFCIPAFAVTPGEFWQEILDHRIRVQAGMLAAFDSHPERYSALDEWTIKDYSLLHDAVKARPQFFNELLVYYGTNKGSLAPFDRAHFDKLIATMNSAEAKDKSLFFARVTPEAEAQLLELEHIADVVDTGVHRTIELGQSSLGSRFLAVVEKAEPEIVEIAEDLECLLVFK